MKRYLLMLSIVGFLGFSEGCGTLQSSQPLYSDDTDAQAVRDVALFDTMTKTPDGYVGQKIRLAGRVDLLQSTPEGYEVIAEWLPYPEKLALEQGPGNPKVEPRRHFLINFKGKRDRTFVTTHGNTFILVGTVAGTKEVIINLFGLKKDLLYVNATCVHVWETGMSIINNAPDSEHSDNRSKTFCADK